MIITSIQSSYASKFLGRYSMQAKGALESEKKSVTKVCSLLEHGCAILSSFKIVVIFNNASAEIKTKSADVLLKMTTILKELRIAQLCSKSERTLSCCQAELLG